MKRFFTLLLCFGLCSAMLTSCLKQYLDKAPEAGLSEQDVFSTYQNFKKYFDAVYGEGTLNLQNAYSLYFTFWGYGHTWDAMTDMSDIGRVYGIQTIKAGIMGSSVNSFTYNTGARPILGSMFRVIRLSNIALENIGMLKDGSPDDVNDMIAQAHFVRAFAHFTLFRFWGPMPYLTKSLGSDDDWDIPRLSKHETLMHIAADFDTAATYFLKANRMRRDAMPGQVGNLNSPDQFRPNGVTAVAMKARTLLYAASPLNNELGAIEWQDAAKANGDAIQLAEQNGYSLLPAADYKTNFVGAPYTNEQLWGWSAGNQSYNSGGISTILNGPFTGSPGGGWAECPTQNAVDKFETKWGEPLNTDAQRQMASTAGHYKEQDPYTNRDPRFYIDIIFNQAPIIGWQNGKAQIWYQMVNGSPTYSELINPTYSAITATGYYNRKLWGDQSVKNQISVVYTDPIIRLAELYLNYAEAANEAYGPTTPAPGSTMTAVQAINRIRNRIGMPDVLPEFLANKDVFRPRIKNERNVELIFEGHYFDDIRRWKDAPVTMAGPLIGIDVEKVPVTTTYPTGFKYTRLPLAANRQSVWKDEMYYFPFDQNQIYKMKNFAPNPVW
jgi:starch-binding outer membrane protein, SusD/RagB family